MNAGCISAPLAIKHDRNIPLSLETLRSFLKILCIQTISNFNKEFCKTFILIMKAVLRILRISRYTKNQVQILKSHRDQHKRE